MRSLGNAFKNFVGSWTLSAPVSQVGLTINAVSGQAALIAQAVTGNLAQMQVNTGGAAEASYVLTIASTASAIFAFNNTATPDVWGIAPGVAGVGVAQAYPLVFTTAATERMRINGSGNVTLSAPSSGTSPTLSLNSLTSVNALQLNAGAGYNAYMALSPNNGTGLGFFGVSGTPGGLTAGDSVGDMTMRSATGFNVAVNGTTSKSFGVNSAGAVSIISGSTNTPLTITGSSAGGLVTAQQNSNNGTAAYNVLTLNNDAGGYIASVVSSSTFTGTILAGLPAGPGSGFYSSGTLPIAIAPGGTSRVNVYATNANALQSVDDGGTMQVVGWRDTPYTNQGNGYTTVLADRGKSIVYATGSAGTYNIAANSSVSYPLGTVLTFVNIGGSTLAIRSTDNLYIGGGPGTVNTTMTLANAGIATAYKFASTSWLVSGAGLTP